MDQIEFTKEQYIEQIEAIINDDNTDKNSLISNLTSLLSYELSEEKCPQISPDELRMGMNELKNDFTAFIELEDDSLIVKNKGSVSINLDLVDINERNLAEIVSRTFKRKIYYKYFHNINNVSELKETALNCFWLIKLKPFTVLRNESPLRASTNEKFALNLILSQIQYLTSLSTTKFKMPDKTFIQDTIYSFKYRDISKEAMILFVDSIANAYGISIDSWT